MLSDWIELRVRGYAASPFILFFAVQVQHGMTSLSHRLLPSTTELWIFVIGLSLCLIPILRCPLNPLENDTFL